MRKLALIGALFLGGCGVFWEDPYFSVAENPLNWLEIRYYNASREPIRRVNVRITGSGEVLVKTGVARRVSDSFAKDIAGAKEDDYRENRFTVPAAHVREIFQNAVNAGLFDRDKTGTSTKYPSAGRIIVASAAMDNKTHTGRDNLFEEDPELAECLLNIVQEFNRPMLRKNGGR